MDLKVGQNYLELLWTWKFILELVLSTSSICLSIPNDRISSNISLNRSSLVTIEIHRLNTRGVITLNVNIFTERTQKQFETYNTVQQLLSNYSSTKRINNALTSINALALALALTKYQHSLDYYKNIFIVIWTLIINGYENSGKTWKHVLLKVYCGFCCMFRLEWLL